MHGGVVVTRVSSSTVVVSLSGSPAERLPQLLLEAARARSALAVAAV